MRFYKMELKFNFIFKRGLFYETYLVPKEIPLKEILRYKKIFFKGKTYPLKYVQISNIIFIHKNIT